MSEGEPKHNPVMVREVIEYLKPFDGGVYFDGTVGMGGHAKMILDASAPGGVVIGVDLDRDAVNRSSEALFPYGERAKVRHGNYKNIVDILAEEGISSVDGIILDLGLGSHQLSSVERGFSVELGGPLDMRYDTSVGIGAKEVVNRFPERELEKIFRELGEERRARAVAKEIVKVRGRGEISDALELSKIVKRVLARGSGGSKGRIRIHPATRTFMALRIFVNRELHNLESFLLSSISVLKEGGVIVVISFHSLEDRIVKTSFRRYSGRGGYDIKDEFGRDEFGKDEFGNRRDKPLISILTKKPVTPTVEEVMENRRARSAKLRAARRIGHED